MYNDTDFQYWQGRESQDITLEFNFKIYEMSKQSQSLNLLRATESFDLSETQIFFLKGNLVWYNYLTFLLQIFTTELHHLLPIRCHRQIENPFNIEIFKDIQRYLFKASNCEKSESY